MKSFKTGIVMVTALVMAALGFMSCSANTDKLTSITVTPTDLAVVLGTEPQRFTATGTFSDGKFLNFTSEVSWSSSNTTVATIGSIALFAGHVTVLTEGTTTITAVEPVNHFTSSAVLFVTKPIAITITPADPVMAIDKSHQFTATATFLLSDMTTTATQSMMSSPSLTWSSLNPLIATVSKGLVKTFGAGSVKISVTDEISHVTGSTTLTVTPGPLTSITVTPAASSMANGASQQYTATGNYDGFPSLDLTSSVSWYSTPAGIVDISNTTGSQGFATAVAVGDAVIKAADPISKIAGTATVTVTP